MGCQMCSARGRSLLTLRRTRALLRDSVAMTVCYLTKINSVYELDLKTHDDERDDDPWSSSCASSEPFPVADRCIFTRGHRTSQVLRGWSRTSWRPTGAFLPNSTWWGERLHYFGASFFCGRFLPKVSNPPSAQLHQQTVRSAHSCFLP